LVEPMHKLRIQAATRAISRGRQLPPQFLRHPQEEAVCLPWQSRGTIRRDRRNIKRDIAFSLVSAELVCYCEGCIDQTSLGGKAVGTVLRLSPAPVALVCGRCDLKRKAFETGDRAPEALVRAARRAGEWIKARLDSGR